HTQPSKYVAVRRVERLARKITEMTAQNLRAVQGKLLHDTALRIDHCRDAVVSCAQQVPAVFDGPESGHLEMLEPSRRVTVPAVIGNIHQNARSLGCQAPHQLREDILITNRDANRPVRGTGGSIPCPRKKVTYF